MAIQAAIIRAQSTLLHHQATLLRQAEVPGGDGLWSCRLSDESLDWTGNSYDLFGVARGSRLHRAQILEFYQPTSLKLLEMVRSRCIARNSGFVLDTEIVTPRGARRWIRSRAGVECENGRPIRLFGTHQDVTADIVRLADLHRSADLDPLTGLPNRRAFGRSFHEAGAPGRRPLGALLLIDLDGFKAINDTHGHAAGDACLQRAAARLARICARADLVARLGGDEFAVIVAAPVAAEDLRALGAAIVAGLGRSFWFGGKVLTVGASVGIAIAEEGSSRGLFARADAALYAAKDSGRNTALIDHEIPTHRLR